MDVNAVKHYLLGLQERIVSAFCAEDPNADVVRDEWTRAEGGGGLSCVVRDGEHIEQAAVNFSYVAGASLPTMASASRPLLANKPFIATGVSLIIHPRNPYVPTMHANVRFFLTDPNDNPHWWFGGGFDLTPYYGFVEDCRHWQQQAKLACEPFGADLYPRFKQWADEYFYLKHRNEPRGIGGLFYDDVRLENFQEAFAFCQSVGDHILPAYLPLFQKRKATPYGERERNFQLYRRGRYVEFNLVYDRGTLFGLHSDGRVESILASIPPEVHWRYNWQPEAESVEANFYRDYLISKDWA